MEFSAKVSLWKRANTLIQRSIVQAAKHPPADGPGASGGAPLSAPGFSRMIERAALAAKLGIKAHAHMLRHACGYKLANDGIDTRSLQAYLGHRNIQSTTRYTALAPDRFKGFWKD